MNRQEIDLNADAPVEEWYRFSNAADLIAEAIGTLTQHCHARSYNAGWWLDPVSAKSLIPGEDDRDFGGVSEAATHAYFPYVLATKIALIHSEVSEMLEAVRVDANDDKLPQYKGVTVEAADVVIRVCDLIGMLTIQSSNSLEYDLASAILDKLAVNGVRADHSIAKRLAPGGKKF